MVRNILGANYEWDHISIMSKVIQLEKKHKNILIHYHRVTLQLKLWLINIVFFYSNWYKKLMNVCFTLLNVLSESGVSAYSLTCNS